jgi:hypothetical protein
LSALSGACSSNAAHIVHQFLYLEPGHRAVDKSLHARTP